MLGTNLCNFRVKHLLNNLNLLGVCKHAHPRNGHAL